MQVSASGLIDIAHHEGICLQPYLDTVDVWTVGLGHTAAAGPPNPLSVSSLTIKEAFDLLRVDLAKQYEPAVRAYAPKNLTQFQYDALTSFCFNLGPGNLKRLASGRTLNQIADAITLYSRAGNNPTAVLGRRKLEQRLFREGVYARPDGLVPVIPVINNRPAYSKGRLIDVRPYVVEGADDTVPPVPLARDVRRLQTILNEGGAGLVVDGVLGPKTRAAIIRFQQQHGLVPDGIAGPLTWAKLEAVAHP